MTDKSFNEMRIDAYHAANKAAELGLTAQDIAQMPWDEYNRLIGNPERPTPAPAGLSAFYAQEEPEKSSNPAAAGRSSAPSDYSPRSNSDAPQAVSWAPQGRPFEELANEGGEEGFLRWRSQRQSSGEGVGIFSGVMSNTAEYQQAAPAMPGATR